jgi:hypothetical protein
MNLRLTRIALATTFAFAVGAGTSATASADKVTMGSTLAGNYDGGVSGAPVLSVQLSYDPSTSPNPVISPANGVITGWKVKSADDGARYTLRVLRPNGPVSLVTATNSNFTGAGSQQAPSAVPAGTGASTPLGAVFSYPASLPINKGDYVGVQLGGSATGLPQAFTNGVHQNLIANNFAGKPTDCASDNLLADEQHDLLLQATVKFCKVPDLKGLKLADAQSKLAAADCGSTVTKKKLKKNKKNKKKKGKVLSQTVPAGSTAAPGTPIGIKVAKLKKK